MRNSLSKQKPLLLGLVVLLLIAAVDVPLWVNFFSWSLLIYKLLSEKYNLPTLSRSFTTVLSVVLLGQIYLEFGTFLGQEASTTLLMGLAGLKAMDYSGSRDHKYLVILGFMLLAMKPLFSLDLYWVPFLLFSFVCLWWALLKPEQKNPLKFLSRLFLLSLPMALILFLAFPRVVFPWAQRVNQNRAEMGFSEQLNPGSSAQLIETDKLIFRAQFSGSAHPLMEDLYWRGGVLTASDGLAWTSVPVTRSESERNLDRPKESPIFNYTIYLEPGNGNYVFALEIPSGLYSSEVFVREQGPSVYRLMVAQNKTIAYHGNSSLQQSDVSPPTEQDLQTPELSAKVKEWVDALAAKKPAEKLEALNDFYRDNKFIYTLNPGRYGSNDLDDFLFERRKGFCEHFAGSYATLARALGIPARVVVGFHGGVWNSFGEFWRVSTKDAHAWSEIYIDGKWKRVDPTAFAAPTRIELGATDYFQSQKSHQGFVQTLILIYDQFIALIENLNYIWATFLIDFDRDLQKDLMLAVKENLGWYIFALTAMALLMILLYRVLNRKQEILNPYQILLQEIFAWAAEKGQARKPSESPRLFLQRSSERWPELRGFAEKFIKNYEESFYKEKKLPLSSQLKKEWQRARRSFAKSPGSPSTQKQ